MQQQDEYQVVERIPTVDEYLAVREGVGWGRLDKQRLDKQMTARGLANALFTVCLLYRGKVIGCGRIIGDGDCISISRMSSCCQLFREKG